MNPISSSVKEDCKFGTNVDRTQNLCVVKWLWKQIISFNYIEIKFR